jgi:DNA gyrase inhibitor GyrI
MNHGSIWISSASIALLLVSAFVLQSCDILSYQSAYPKTDSGDVKLKIVPESRILRAEMDGAYFERSNQLFMSLFNYIKKNEIDMTVPVEAGIDEASMVFYVGAKDLDKAKEDEGGVTVKTVPERLVASMGARGSYTKKNVLEARNKLDQWLESQDEYRAAGDAYAVYWNGPFTPGFMKRFEIHVPVERIEKLEEPAEPDVAKNELE